MNTSTPTSLSDTRPLSRRILYSTAALPKGQRREWLSEVIGREYANVKITPPGDSELFNEMIIYPWNKLRLSAIRSNAITLERLPREPDKVSQDAYFAVVHLDGSYQLQQNGREVQLKPGDMTLYDATQPHRICCSQRFAKLILSIPRPLLRERVAAVEHCTALHICGQTGIGAIAAQFLRVTAEQADDLSEQQFSRLSGLALDQLTLALASVRPTRINLSDSRALLIERIKQCIETLLPRPDLNPALIAEKLSLSPRYLNTLFNDEDTSLMRYVLKRRLHHCRQDLETLPAERISAVAFRWGFNDLAHFSRAFRQQFGCSASECKEKSTRVSSLNKR